jgi:hypothetical protein
LDNGGNGLADCSDPACSDTTACPPPVGEICGDGIDNDADGFADCKDVACSASPVCLVVEICGDGIDNDNNALLDCSDPACLGTVPCPAPTPEICDDHIDNNGDGLLDCADPLCFDSPRCKYEICGDGIDNDGNGLIDCADSACGRTSKCLRPPVDICNDGIDNDGDGLSDCGDPKCAGRAICAHPAAHEHCQNGVDDDGNGLVDCADPRCSGRAVCLREICSNGLDDDRDGLIDCADPSCKAEPACAAPPAPRPLAFSAHASDSAAGYGPELMADGNTSTRWWTAQNHDVWVRIDLGGVFRVSEVDIRWHAKNAKNYKVKVSKDGRYWRTVSEIDNGDGALDALVFGAREARYIMLDLEDPAASGYSIKEVQVFQAPSGSLAASGPASGTGGGTSLAPPRTNLALNAVVSASDSAVGFEPQLAVDGNMGTRWKARGTDQQWIRVDLGSVHTVAKVVLRWHRRYAENYKVKVSLDGIQWQTVAEVKHSDGRREGLSFHRRQARYVQIDCEYAARPAASGTPVYSIYEVEVYEPRKARLLR